jgi:hypothetical protein
MTESGPGSNSRRRGYAPWGPYAKQAALLDQVHAVLDEYHDHRPLTIRQVFYRLVGAYGYRQDENASRRLRDVFDRGRRARLIPFEWVRDEGIHGDDPGELPAAEESPDDWLARRLAGLKDEWEFYSVAADTGQPRRIELWCEATGMVPQLERVALPYAVPVFSGSGGAESITARHELTARCARQPELPTVMLHVGDHDVDGVDIYTAFREDVTAFLAEDCPDAEVEFVRVAVTPDQIEREGLVTYPPKPTTDETRLARYERWHANGYDETAQAEALPPDRLAEIVCAAILDHYDVVVWEAAERRQRAAWERLRGEFERRFGGEA